ncbi:MAG: SDR family oxidoreductase [Acidobacteria bacterium]|nr:SDR family oxidoreductase [Acidobacteriota bacterium]
MPQQSYALVTSASSAIGECFARALAARGRNLALVARSREKLESLAAELGSRHRIEAEAIAFDLSETGAAAALVEILRQRRLKIGLLVNNAGFGVRGRFWDLPFERQSQMLRLNVLALAELTHLLLPAMVEDRRGAIINVSSTAGFQPIPYTAAYAATKAFVTSFSEALREELRPFGIAVVTLCPGGTRTNFFRASGYGRPKLLGGLQAAEEVVAEALKALDRGGGLTVPRLINKLGIFSQRFAPRGLVVKITGRMFRV